MTAKELAERYPKLYSRFDDQDQVLRNLITVDENDKDDVFDSDLNDDIYDPEIYTHIVYIHDVVVKAIGDLLSAIPEILMERDDFEDCYDSEGDLWGIKTKLNDEQIAFAALDEIEKLLE